MLQGAVKILITAILIVAIAEAAKRSSLIAALIASLPLTSILAIIWSTLKNFQCVDLTG